jgi:hypothetical protein
MKLRLKLKLMGVAAFVVVAVLFPAVLYFAIGALFATLLAIAYTVTNGLTRDGERKGITTEVHRRVRGIVLRRALVRREAAHLDAVEAERNQLWSER